MGNVAAAKKLLAWNNLNLTSYADLKKSELADLFAEAFQVNANGKSYDANYDNYYDFLNRFRADIKSIDYQVRNFIEAAHYITMPLEAYIVRNDGSAQTFDAILILQFDHNDKIILWDEVYVERKNENS